MCTCNRAVAFGTRSFGYAPCARLQANRRNRHRMSCTLLGHFGASSIVLSLSPWSCSLLHARKLILWASSLAAGKLLVFWSSTIDATLDIPCIKLLVQHPFVIKTMVGGLSAPLEAQEAAAEGPSGGVYFILEDADLQVGKVGKVRGSSSKALKVHARHRQTTCCAHVVMPSRAHTVLLAAAPPTSHLCAARPQIKCQSKLAELGTCRSCGC